MNKVKKIYVGPRMEAMEMECWAMLCSSTGNDIGGDASGTALAREDDEWWD